MSSQFLWHHSPILDSLDSVQQWEVWDTYENARDALKALSLGRAREQPKGGARLGTLGDLPHRRGGASFGEARAEAEQKRVEHEEGLDVVRTTSACANFVCQSCLKLAIKQYHRNLRQESPTKGERQASAAKRARVDSHGGSSSGVFDMYSRCTRTRLKYGE